MLEFAKQSQQSHRCTAQPCSAFRLLSFIVLLWVKAESPSRQRKLKTVFSFLTLIMLSYTLT